MNTESNQTNWRRCTVLASLFIIVLCSLMVTGLARNNWQLHKESKYIIASRDARRAVPILEAQLVTNKIALSAIQADAAEVTSTRWAMVKKDELQAELVEAQEENRKLLKEYGESLVIMENKTIAMDDYYKSKKLQENMICDAHTDAIQRESKRLKEVLGEKFSPDDLATRFLSCPAGGKYVLGSTNETVTCTHTVPAIAQATTQ